MEPIIDALVLVGALYMLIGVIFAIPFSMLGVKKVDPSAAEGTWGFKLLIIPGVAFFWPLMAKRWLKKEMPPTECSYHRKAAKESN